MKIILEKDLLCEKLSLASRFISERISSPQTLQGVLITGSKEGTNLYSSNLNSYFHTKIKIRSPEKFVALIEPRKIIEFLSLLPAGRVEIEIQEKKIIFRREKTIGVFSLLNSTDFPLPPKINASEQKIKTKAFKKNLEQVLFSAAKDEGRPALSGVNAITNGDLTLVATDGFRLSLAKMEKQVSHPPFIAPAAFLEEVLRLIGDEQEIQFFFLKEEKTIAFKIGDNELFSRLIEGEFPPFEKVIPDKFLTRAVVDKEELIRAIKLVAVFARDLSNVVVLNFKENELVVRPKSTGQENKTTIEIKTEGEEQTTAFNYKFLLDFLNHVSAGEKNIIIEILRADAPVVFKEEGGKDHLHIIMPVRIQE